MSDDILIAELGKGDAGHLFQHRHGMSQAALRAFGEINLAGVARHDRGGSETDPGQEHFHLLAGGVLRFVQNDERVVKGAAAHKGEGRHFNGVPLDVLVHRLETQHFIKCVVEWPQIRVNLLRQVAGQETQALACFDGWAHQQYALYLLVE